VVGLMKIKYSADADVVIMELNNNSPVDSVDLQERVIVHLDKNRQPVEIELLDASKITSLEDVAFSIISTKAKAS
jgi:uncharacterized protein YuzE